MKKTSFKEREHQYKVSKNDELMKFLIKVLPGKNRNNIKTLLRDRQVMVNDEVTSQFNRPLQQGDTVLIRPEKIPIEKQYHGYTIIYEDKYLVVIDKHAGVLSMSDGKRIHTAYSMLSEHVKKQNAGHKIFIVHRLDRDTSGVMLFVKDKKLQEKMQENWQDTVFERTYLALVQGIPEIQEDTVASFITESKAMKVYSSQDAKNGLRAVTHYKVIKSNKFYSLLKVDIETGRKNQIRVHMKDIGHPIVGDKKYDSKINPIGRLGLHASVLGFFHPVTNEKMRFESDIPKKFRQIL